MVKQKMINKDNFLFWLLCILFVILVSQILKHMFFKTREGLDNSSSDDLKSAVKKLEDKLKIDDNRDKYKKGLNLGSIYFKNKLIDDGLSLLKKDDISTEDMQGIDMTEKMVQSYTNMIKLLDDLPVSESSK